jgi:hypothetical protein
LNAHDGPSLKIQRDEETEYGRPRAVEVGGSGF